MFVAPEPPSYLPPAVALAPAIVRPHRLTGDRLTIFKCLFGTILVIGVLGAIASVSTGYEVYINSGHELVKSRPAGGAGTIYWCLGGAALALWALLSPTRRTARIVGWSLIAHIFVSLFAVAATMTLISFDDFSLSKHAEETGNVALLQFAVWTMVLAGPIVLLTHWRLFRAERYAAR
jgi:hypothetical protein